MPKQRTPGRSNKHVRTAKLLITAFAISATMAGCAALNVLSNAQAIFAPAITVDLDDLATPNWIDSLKLTMTNQVAPDNDDPTIQPSHRSTIQLR